MYTMCLKAISSDLLESVLPKPEMSAEDLLAGSLLLERYSPCFGGASFLMFTTLSTIFVPITTGLTSLSSEERILCLNGNTLPLLYALLPFEVSCFEGELGFCLVFPLDIVLTDDDLALLAATGLPLVAEAGLSGNERAASSSGKFGTSEGFEGLVLIDGKVPREGLGSLELLALNFEVEDDRPLGRDAIDEHVGFDGHRLGVADLDVCFVVDTDLSVGVDDRAEVFAGVVDLTGGAEALVFTREVGVADLEGFVLLVNEGREVGVADLEAVAAEDFDEGFLLLAHEEFSCPDCEFGCLDAMLLTALDSSWMFTS